MSIDQLRKQYFWLKANQDKVTKTEPEPPTFKGSLVEPLIDMKAYIDQLRKEIEKLGKDPKPENNKGDFIYIAGWLFSWFGGTWSREGNPIYVPIPVSTSTASVTGKPWTFDIDPRKPVPGKKHELSFLDLLITKAKAGVDVRVLGWVSYALFDMPYRWIFIAPLLINPIARPEAQEKVPYAKFNGYTMNSVKAVRAEAKKAKLKNFQAMLNMLGHPVGSAHMKMAIMGKHDAATDQTEGVGFTGGLDLSQWRWAEYGHRWNKDWDPDIFKYLYFNWHDIQALVKGKAVNELYEVFRRMWNENLSREPTKLRFEGDLPSYISGTTKVPKRDKLNLNPPPTYKHHVQSLTTVPSFNFKWYNFWPEGKAASWAPKGRFDLKAAWKKGISGAKKYIYMEDNSPMSQEVLSWIDQAIKNNTQLKVIIVTGGGVDPADPVLSSKKNKMLRNHAINKGLINYLLSEDDVPQINEQVRLFQAWGESITTLKERALSYVSSPVTENQVKTVLIATGWTWQKKPTGENLKKPLDKKVDKKGQIKADMLKGWHLRIQQKAFPIVGNPIIELGKPIVVEIKIAAGENPPKAGDQAKLFFTYGIYVHAKITIVDDNWAMIGSNNIWRRSLYTDWEHAVAFMDEDGKAVKGFRQRLWSEHFKATTSQSQLPDKDFFVKADLDKALDAWWSKPSTDASSFLPKRGAHDLGPEYLRRITLPVPQVDMSSQVKLALDETYDPDSRSAWGGCGTPDTL